MGNYMNAIIGLVNQDEADVLISIKPKYVDKILRGEKKFEFRKAVFKTKRVRKVFIYSSAPVQCIVASFEVEDILQGSPNKIWADCKEFAGIEEEAYFDYFNNREQAYSIKIKNLNIFKEPIRPSKHIEGFKAPQSYMYVDRNLAKVLEGSSSVRKSIVNRGMSRACATSFAC